MRGIEQYQTARKQVDNEQLLLLLFQEAVMRLARVASYENNDPRWITDIHHVRAIVLELRDALDVETSPELCGRLHALYSWCFNELIDAEKSRDTTQVTSVRDVLVKLLEGFQTAVTQQVAAK